VVSSPSQSGYYGNIVAGPVFLEIAEKIHANRLELQTGLAEATPPDGRAPVTYSGHAGDLLTAAKALHVPVEVRGEGEWLATSAGDSAVIAKERVMPGDALGLVPNVMGMGLKDALYILENRGLHVRVTGSGMVRKQSLQPGSRCFRGSTIWIELNT
jgi:cell division protein FtsI (penicillin-binding protein 3)